MLVACLDSTKLRQNLHWFCYSLPWLYRTNTVFEITCVLYRHGPDSLFLPTSTQEFSKCFIKRFTENVTYVQCVPGSLSMCKRSLGLRLDLCRPLFCRALPNHHHYYRRLWLLSQNHNCTAQCNLETPQHLFSYSVR